VDFKTDRVFGEGAEDILIERHKSQLLYYKKAVEEMTGCEVKHTYIYSFSLMKEIEVG
jgi:ATP-dependent helicase/nuclease subunit A